MPLILRSSLILGTALVAATAQAAPPAAAAATTAVSSAATATPRARAAIPEFQVDGETSPALVIQLQDGFVVGLTRAGIQVLDSVDVGQRLQGHPELEKCDNPLCLKQLAEVLQVRYLLRVRVNVAGNSYRMTARLFHAEGARAVMPALTQSRFCDVCTVAEAREVMIRLADAVRRPLDETPGLAGQADQPGAAGSSLLPLVALGAGLVALAAGAGLYLSAEHTAKSTPALGGALMGAGLTVTGFGVYLMVADARRQLAPGVALAARF
jgi:hypothetical protein